MLTITKNKALDCTCDSCNITNRDKIIYSIETKISILDLCRDCLKELKEKEI